MPSPLSLRKGIPSDMATSYRLAPSLVKTCPFTELVLQLGSGTMLLEVLSGCSGKHQCQSLYGWSSGVACLCEHCRTLANIQQEATCRPSRSLVFSRLGCPSLALWLIPTVLIYPKSMPALKNNSFMPSHLQCGNSDACLPVPEGMHALTLPFAFRPFLISHLCCCWTLSCPISAFHPHFQEGLAAWVTASLPSFCPVWIAMAAPLIQDSRIDVKYWGQPYKCQLLLTVAGYWAWWYLNICFTEMSHGHGIILSIADTGDEPDVARYNPTTWGKMRQEWFDACHNALQIINSRPGICPVRCGGLSTQMAGGQRLRAWTNLHCSSVSWNFPPMAASSPVSGTGHSDGMNISQVFHGGPLPFCALHSLRYLRPGWIHLHVEDKNHAETAEVFKNQKDVVGSCNWAYVPYPQSL